MDNKNNTISSITYDLIKKDIICSKKQKIVVKSPSGEEIQIKFKKLQNYINKGYTQV